MHNTHAHITTQNMRTNTSILPMLAAAIVVVLILQRCNTKSHAQHARYTRSTYTALHTLEDVADELFDSINYIGNKYVRNPANRAHDRRWLQQELLSLKEALNNSISIIQNMSHADRDPLQREIEIVSDYQAHQLSEIEEEIARRNMVSL